MHGTCAAVDAAITKAARQIEKGVARACSRPDVVRVEEDPVRIIRIHGDSLVGIVLAVIAVAILTVSKRAALRALHIPPRIAAVCCSPGTQLAGGVIIAPFIVISGHG